MDTTYLGSLAGVRSFYESGATKSYSFREEQLKKLKKALTDWESRLADALYKDFHKSEAETYATETGLLQAEISYTLKHLQQWMRPQHVSPPMFLFRSSGVVLRDSLGVALIIAPWNYPLLLLLSPLVGAIAGGNCAVLKPSELTPHTSHVIKQMLESIFDQSYICVIEGNGAEVVPQLINNFRFDHIFFTGGTAIGKEVAMLAAKELVPVTLELGGKSPCIVDKDADITIAAKRIVWGKFTNAGQTCVAPDYLLVHTNIKDKLIAEMKKAIDAFYGDSLLAEDYGRIINEKHFDKLVSFLQNGDIAYGGQTKKDELYIAPSLLENVPVDAAVMQEEIFGPILPIFSFTTHDEAIRIIEKNPNPLALYIFTKSADVEKKYIEDIRFGGGCVNNTLVHLADPKLPFGGVANSGMGAYHGKYSFDTFTRPKSILKSSSWPDFKIKYPPYKGKMKFFKWLLK